MARAKSGAILIGSAGWQRQALAPLQAALREATEAMLPGVLGFIGEHIVNIAKDKNRAGAWNDITSNLRNSLTWKVLKPGERARVPYLTATEGTQNVEVTNNSKQAVLIVFAGMRYGIYVEFKPNHWVLSGAVEQVRPEATKLLKDGLGKSFRSRRLLPPRKQAPIDQAA